MLHPIAMEKSLSSTRRQVYLLSDQDLREHLLWEFCSDEESIEDQDEATLRPAEARELQGYVSGAYVMATDVIFADGSTEAGYVYSGEPRDFGCTQPHVVIAGKQIGFWLGSLRFAGNLEGIISLAYQSLGRSPESAFPLTVRSKVKVNDALLTSSVEGFMARDESGGLKLFR
ncbi:MAG TPA: hypothetical protein VGG18_02650 [Granulicella sp.]